LTHFLSTGFLAIPLLSISFYDIFGWKGKRGLVMEAGFVLMLVSILMLRFEIGESMNPAVYRNLFWDSAKDVFQGLLSTVLNILVYRTIVPAGIEN